LHSYILSYFLYTFSLFLLFLHFHIFYLFLLLFLFSFIHFYLLYFSFMHFHLTFLLFLYIVLLCPNRSYYIWLFHTTLLTVNIASYQATVPYCAILYLVINNSIGSSFKLLCNSALLCHYCASIILQHSMIFRLIFYP